MKRHVADVLQNIADEYRDDIFEDGRNYVEVDIGKRAGSMGHADLKEQYRQVNAVVPLKHPVPGMKVRIDGRTFVNYAKHDSGIAVPGYVAKDAGILHKAFVPNHSMILNCA